MLPKFLQVLKDWTDGWPKPVSIAQIQEEPKTSFGKAGASFTNVPAKWAWIVKIPGLPNLVREGMHELGVKENITTAGNNTRIIGWADEVKRFVRSPYIDWAADWYNKDSIPWCGLYMALISCRTGRKPIDKYLTALAWAGWEKSVDWRNRRNIWTGDVAVFTRDGGGHVAIIIGVTKDQNYILCLGGNQSDAVTLALFPISRLYTVRRPNYTIKPTGAIYREVSSTGVPISTREA